LAAPYLPVAALRARSEATQRKKAAIKSNGTVPQGHIK